MPESLKSLSMPHSHVLIRTCTKTNTKHPSPVFRKRRGVGGLLQAHQGVAGGAQLAEMGHQRRHRHLPHRQLRVPCTIWSEFDMLNLKWHRSMSICICS